jgi:putative ABC transport system substrate-binding protein
MTCRDNFFTSPWRGEVGPPAVKRRSFLALLGGAAAYPLVSFARADERMRKIGILMGGAEHDLDWQRLQAAFDQEFKTLGWLNGRDIRIDYRWPGDDIERINAAATELVETGPDIIVTAATYGVQAVRLRTDTIPIIFVNAADPIGNGLVPNFDRPGGNITGFAAAEYTISETWLEIIKEIAPRTGQLAVVFNPDTASAARNFLKPLETAARAQKVKPVSTPFKTDADAESVIESFARAPNGAILAMPDSSTALSRRAIIETASRKKLPAVYPFRFFATDGGLASYGADIAAQCRKAVAYVDQVLRGKKAGDLPVQPAAKFELVINLKAARAQGLSIPQALIARADEVID